MNVRNAKYNAFGTIDFEVEHPTLGWIPSTASQNDQNSRGREIYEALIEAGDIAAYIPPSQEDLAVIAQHDINRIKQIRKSELIKEKMESLLSSEFAEVDSASDEASIRSVIIRQ